jgi:hypothetical protein
MATNESNSISGGNMSERHERDFYFPDPTVRIRVRPMLVLLVGLMLLAKAIGVQAQTQPWFTASVLTGISPVSTKFTWTCPAGTVSANAISPGNQTAWTGLKSPVGSQTLTGIKLTADYKIECTGPAGTGSATLSWTPPNTNTDGSVLTNLAGYRIVWGLTSNTLGNQIQIANPGTTSYVVDKLPGGTLLFAVKAYSSVGIESDPSNIQTKTITVAPPVVTTASVTITVQTQPAPPVLSTVDTTAYSVNKATDALALNAVGTVALGVSCKPEYDANGLNVVPRNLVKFKTATKPLVVVAKCG